MSQRDTMRELYKKNNGNRDSCIRDYAKLEEEGKVKRKINTHGLTPEQYAKALYNDGLRKGWLKEES